jgi:hypothetical protein
MPTIFTSDAAVERIARGLLDRSLPKIEWTHAAHFAAVLWLLRDCAESDVIARLPGWIRAYNEATGVANTDSSGYHETITLASIRAASTVLAAHSNVTPLHQIVNVLMATELGRSAWLLRHWSRERLFSSEARRHWLDPDLEPLPF